MYRRIRIPLGIALVLSLLFPVTTYGTTVLAFGADDLIARADHIFHGVCTDRHVTKDDRGRLVTHYSFVVTETLKGKHEVVVKFTLPGGQKDGRATVIPGLSQHGIGDEVILFLGASEATSPFRFPIGLDQGLYRVRTDAQGDKRVKRSLNGLRLIDKGAKDKPQLASFPENLPIRGFKQLLRDRLQKLKDKPAPTRPKKPVDRR